MASTGTTATAATAQKLLNPLLIRRLYRSMLKTSKPFTSSLQNVTPDSITNTAASTKINDEASSTTQKPTTSLRTPIVMNCLLHRTGYEDESWQDFLRGFTTTISTTTTTTNPNQKDNNNELLTREEREQTLFRILLREVLCGGGSGGTVPPLSDSDQNMDPTTSSSSSSSSSSQQSSSASSSLGLKIMQFPIHVRQNPNRIYQMIHREFRIPIDQHIFDGTTRQNMAFRCIREMNKKLMYAYHCEQKYNTPPATMHSKKIIMPTKSLPTPTTTTTSSTTSHHKIANTKDSISHPNPFHYQMAKHVRPLPLVPSSSYLRPGVFLLAHPHMTGYFRRSVICILDHRTGDENDPNEDENDDDIHTAAATSDETVDEEEEEDDDDGDDEDEEFDEETDADDDDDDQEMEEENLDEYISIKESDDEISETIDATTTENMSGNDEIESTTVHMEEHIEMQLDEQQPNIEKVQPKRTKSKSSRKKKQKKQQQYGTYGLIVNRFSVSPYSGKTLCMNDVLRPLPSTIMKAFGKYPIREGGPVHMSVQMLYQINTSIANSMTTTTPSPSMDDSSEENNTTNHHNIGGYILPTIQPDITATDDIGSSTTDISNAIGSCDTDKAVYYRGNIMNVIKAMESGIIENGEDDVSFFVGASCWSVGQLEREIENGFWLPCIGPTSIAQTGMCDYYNTTSNSPIATTPSSTNVKNDVTPSSPQLHHHQPQAQQHNHPRPEADLWLSMMSACGIEEAKLAHLLYKDDGKDKNGAACDSMNTTNNSS